MNQRFDFTGLGGFPLTQDTLAFMQGSYRGAFAALASLVGNKTILSGCVVNVAANTVSDGWISYNGALMPFMGGGFSPGVVVQETAAALTFQDASSQNVQFTQFATCGGPATFPFSDLKAPQNFRDSWCAKDVKMVDCDAAYIAANFVAGLGVNERDGWAICDGSNTTKDRRGTFTVAWDNRIVDPVNSIWDIVYNTMGHSGGAKQVALLLTQIPKHRHVTHGFGQITRNGGGVHGYLSRLVGAITNNYSGGGSDQFGAAETPDTAMQTGDTGGDGTGATVGHENRPPFIVTLFIQKL